MRSVTTPNLVLFSVSFPLNFVIHEGNEAPSVDSSPGRMFSSSLNIHLAKQSFCEVHLKISRAWKLAGGLVKM